MRAWAFAACLPLLALEAGAHQRSQSFSSWRVEGRDVRVVWTVLALEATRLGPPSGSLQDLGALLADHVAATVEVRRNGEPCGSDGPPHPLRARPGHLRVEARFRCAETGPIEVESRAFLDVAPAHVHFARVSSPGERPRELLFSDAMRVQTLLAPEGTGEGARLSRYVALGMEHILVGYDHLAFLLSLILLGGGLRGLVAVVTGFTLGHSVTLSLAALGLVQVDGALVEALIGYSIALVAAENLAVRGGVHAGVARAAGAALAVAAGLAASGAVRGGPPATTLLGLALFSACYLGLAATAGGSRRLRPAVTLLFGLVHGFGFASVLGEIGLPRERLVAALFGFNLGVELGQLAAVVAMVGLGSVAGSLLSARPRTFAVDGLSAALCALGLLWFLGRAYG